MTLKRIIIATLSFRMANTLIIYAHPKTTGHCSKVLEYVTERLKGHDYELIDLYRLNYDPVLYENELYTAGNKEISVQNKNFQEKVKKADKLIFIYPVWWGSMPAILKGFFDRVFVPGFAFRYSKAGIPKGLLPGKSAAVFITSGGNRFLYWLIGNRPVKLIKKDILGFFAIKSKVFLIDNARKLSKEKESNIKSTVDKGLRYLY